MASPVYGAGASGIGSVLALELYTIFIKNEKGSCCTIGREVPWLLRSDNTFIWKASVLAIRARHYIS